MIPLCPSYPLSAGMPFVGLLLSISFFPILFPKFWHKCDSWVIGAWGLLACFFIMFYSPCLQAGLHIVAKELLHEYIPFMIVIGSLYLVSTGIEISIAAPSSSLVLTLFLGLGAVLSSFMGTAGASILLIYPLIKLIQNRIQKTHVIIFFIFLVANCGGCLTPLGDPPLFMGFLHGVHFSWTLKNLWQPFIANTSMLLMVFYMFDKFLTRKEKIKFDHRKHFKLEGLPHLFILLTVLGIFFALGSLEDPGHTTFGISEWIFKWIGLSLIMFQTTLSLMLKRKKPIHWAPIQEVGKIFIVIFISLIPIVSLLSSDQSSMINSLKDTLNVEGLPNPFRYFWLCGFFSAFLDNAPTYLIFFKMTGKSAPSLMNESAQTLKAISLGSIFMGAFTYIGNAPNLIVRSIALEEGIFMPSFLGYILYAIIFLLPALMITSLLFL